MPIENNGMRTVYLKIVPKAKPNHDGRWITVHISQANYDSYVADALWKVMEAYFDWFDHIPADSFLVKVSTTPECLPAKEDS